MHVLITGHTGFKGAWLSLVLRELGHEVSGVALDPEAGSLFEGARVAEVLTHDYRIDIRDAPAVRAAFTKIRPELIIHLAAQPLVRRSYEEPRFTLETNVMGTYNVLEAAQTTPSLRALVMVTTDKVYKNLNREEGYREEEALGGDDPYSVSKAMADLLIQSWVKSFPGVPTAIVRGGNVIGGGDVSADRLLVDLISGFVENTPTEIRYPDAVRPWQHVLDCLNGYLFVANALLRGGGEGAWNIGPDERSFIPVRDIAVAGARMWGSTAGWRDVSSQGHLHEASLLALNVSKARSELGWHDLIPYPQSLEWTINWAKKVSQGEDPRAVTLSQIRHFLSIEDRVSLP